MFVSYKIRLLNPCKTEFYQAEGPHFLWKLVELQQFTLPQFILTKYDRM